MEQNDNNEMQILPLHDSNLSQSNSTQVITRRKYALNISKVLRNKIEKCEKVAVEYEVTSGGITGAMDTATFELFRAACTTFYKQIPATDGKCVNNKSFDKHGKAMVQQTYFLKRQVNGNETGYTLNLYPTKNKMLLNGKDVDWFMDSHLPEIHCCMIQAVQEEGLGSVANYNHILVTQLQKVLDERQPAEVGTASKSDNHRHVTEHGNTQAGADVSCLPPKGTNMQHSSEPTQICPKCKRAVQSRAALCEKGNHWVHYFCDRLSQSEIDRLSNDPGFIYRTCKACIVADNTDLKTVMTISSDPKIEANGNENEMKEGRVEADSIQRQCERLVLPRSPPGSPTTAARAILNEENDQTCCVCAGQMEEGTNRCGICTLPCHDHCTCMTPESDDTCLACAASMNQAEASQHEVSQQLLSQQADKPKGGSPNAKVEEPQPTKSTKERKTTQGPVVVKEKKQANDTSGKLRELRQLETKLRKWEEELRLN